MKKFLLLSSYLIVLTSLWAQDTVYSCDFDHPSDTAGWVLLNGNQFSNWVIGRDSSMSSNALFISNIDTFANYYNRYNVPRSVVYAYRQVVLSRGVYDISYDWRCMGWNGWERNFGNSPEAWNTHRPSDYMRVALVPDTVSFTAGAWFDEEQFTEYSVPEGGIAIDGGSPLTEWDWSGDPNDEIPPPADWHTYTSEVVIREAGTFLLVFFWIDESYRHAYQPPAAIDNVLIAFSDCPTPIDVYLDRMTAHSFDVHWSDMSGGRTTQYQVELCLESDTGSQCTTYITSDTLIHFTGLLSDTDYTVYILPLCDSGMADSALRLRVHSLCGLIATLPYYEFFDGIQNGQFVPCWLRINTDSSHVHCWNGQLCWSLNYENSPGYVALRGINTDFLPLNNLQLSFSCTNMQGFEVGVMTSPTDTGSFVSVPVVSLGMYNYVAEFYNYLGTGNIIAIKSTRGGGYFDNFVLGILVPCRTVRNLTVGGVGAEIALLTWDVYENVSFPPDSFEVRVECVDGYDSLIAPMVDYLSFTTTEPRCIVTGLTAGSAYRAWVRARCTNDRFSNWQSIRFSTPTLTCRELDSSALDTVVFSTDTVRTSGVPAMAAHTESYCRSIYTAEELHRSGVTTGLVGMDYTYVGGSVDYTISIYITPTAAHENLSPLDLVYGPAHHDSSRVDTVHHYTFDRPFLWDGLSNIKIITMIHHDTLASGPTIFGAYSSSTGEGWSTCRYRDTLPYTADNIRSSTSYEEGSSYRPTVTFYTMPCGEVDGCLSPMMLTVDSLEAYSASLSWWPGYHETSWRVQYREVGDTVWSMADTHIATTHYCLATLTPLQQYEVRVLPNCDSINDSVFAQTAFTTLCAPIDSLPLVESFEDFVLPGDGEGMTEFCWYGHGYPFPSTSTDYAYDGAKSLWIRAYNSPGQVWVVLPPMGVPLDSLQVSFRAYATSDYHLRVGVMTAPTDYSTFVEVERVSPIRLNTWELMEIPFETYAGQGKRIALAMEGIEFNGVYVDDLRVDRLPSCPRPSHVTITDVTSHTATLQWNGPNALVYDMEYGPAGFALGTGILLRDPADSVVLTGLNVATAYDVYLRSLCAEDTSNWTRVISFATACGRIDSIPYIQNFGCEATRPPCWTCGAYWARHIPSIVNRTDGTGRVVVHSLLMRGNVRPQTSYAMLPAIDTVRFPIHTLQVTVEADCGYNEYYFDGDSPFSQPYSHYLAVGVSRQPNDLTTFTPVDTLVINEFRTRYTVPLAAARGAGEYITFESFSTVYNTSVLLDSVAVEPIANCQPPYDLSAYAITDTSATLTWRPYDRVIGGVVEYMPHGVPLGMGTRVNVIDTTLTVTGLTPNSSYDFYVRSICTADDTSVWCYRSATFATQQIPATIPYAYNFDSVQEWDNWGTFSNCPATWYRGMTYGRPMPPCMYVSIDSGSTASTLTRQPVNAVAYRDIDFGYIDTSILLSFSVQVGGMYSQYGLYNGEYFDGLAVLLVDPSEMMVPSSRYYQSPWGWLYNLTPIANISGVTSWNDYSLVLEGITGVHRLAFYWYGGLSANQATFVGQPATIDNISIDYDICPTPTNVTVSSVTTTTANVTWRGAADGRYRVLLLPPNSIWELTSDTVVGTSFRYTNLMPGTTYKVRVSRLCPDHETTYALATLSTPVCDGGVSDTIGDPLQGYTHYDLPLHNAYNYSYTQQLVLASELGSAGEISSINFLYDNNEDMTVKRHCTIYLGHTTLSRFTMETDFVPPDSLKVVYMGPLNCFSGWNRIYFNRPFVYDGTSNLVIAVDDNSGVVHRDSPTHYEFVTNNTTDLMALVYYSNTDDVDCSMSVTLNAFRGGKTALRYRSVMSLDVCPPNPCAAPRLREPRVGPDSILLRWIGNGQAQGQPQRFLFGYRVASSNHWVVDDRVLTDTFYSIYNYFFDTDYVYHVRQYCDEGISNWAMGLFNTADMPCLPPLGLRASDINNKSARLSWTPDGNNISYRVHVWGPSYDTMITTYLAGCRVRNLHPASRFYAAVEVRCEYLDEPSIWSDTISFETPVCPDVTGLTALDVQGNSVLLDWDDNEETVSWLIEWGLQGFDQGTGVLVAADHHPFLLTGLTGETVYDIVVRAVCGDDYYSEAWSPRLTITTAYSGIDEFSILNSQFSIFPNPTTGDVMLTLPDYTGNVQVEVVDMAGRQCLKVDSYTPPLSEKHSLDVSLPSRTYPGSSSHPSQEGTADASNTQAIKQSNNQAITITLPTSQLPAGAYYVRLTGDRFSAVRKLLKIER